MSHETELDAVDAKNISADDRRSSDRDFSARSVATIISNDQSIVCQILDESNGGLGLFVSNQPPFTQADTVMVHITGRQARSAEVRYVRPHHRGGFQIGLHWIADRGSNPSGH